MQTMQQFLKGKSNVKVTFQGRDYSIDGAGQVRKITPGGSLRKMDSAGKMTPEEEVSILKELHGRPGQDNAAITAKISRLEVGAAFKSALSKPLVQSEHPMNYGKKM